VNRAALLGIAAVAACSGTIRFDLHIDGGGAGTGTGGAGGTGGVSMAEAGVDRSGDLDMKAADTGVDMAADLGIDAPIDLGGDRGVDTGVVDTGVDMAPAPGTCNVEGQCPSGLHCETSSKTCVECLNSNQCTSPNKCDTNTHRCVRCLMTSDCGGGNQACSTGRRCVFTCVKNGTPTCPASGPTNCEDEGGGGTCAPCEDNTGCTSGTNNICVPTEGVCVQCTATMTSACTGTTSQCDVVTGRCVQCTSGSQCTQPNARFCNPTTGTCVGL